MSVSETVLRLESPVGWITVRDGEGAVRYEIETERVVPEVLDEVACLVAGWRLAVPRARRSGDGRVQPIDRGWISENTETSVERRLLALSLKLLPTW